MQVHVEQARSIKVRGCRGADPPPPAPIFVAAIVLVFTYKKNELS